MGPNGSARARRGQKTVPRLTERRERRVVRKRGLEPPLPFGNKLLRLARLPVPPLPQVEGITSAGLRSISETFVPRRASAASQPLDGCPSTDLPPLRPRSRCTSRNSCTPRAVARSSLGPRIVVVRVLRTVDGPALGLQRRAPVPLCPPSQPN